MPVKSCKHAGPSLTLVELGAGTASKTCILIEELLQRQSRALFYPIDVSPSALEEAVRQLGRQFPSLRVNPIVADYTGGVPALSRISGRKLVLYIGSSIGNFDPPDAIRLLRRIRQTLRAGDALLLGADFAKSPKILLPAYDDSQGVTASFSKNILGRLNRELDADFNLDLFRHVALWNRRDVPHGDLPGKPRSANRLHSSSGYGPVLRAAASAFTPKTVTNTRAT